MDIYNLGKVDSTIDGVIGPLLHGFNVIGVSGRPLVTFSFDTQERPKPRVRRCETSLPRRS